MDMKQQSDLSLLEGDESLSGYLVRLWRHRRILLKAGCLSAAVGIVMAFSLPKEYTVTVTLSPESGQSGISGSLAGAASLLGFGNLSASADGDALNYTLFPEILSSTPFAAELYAMSVREEDSEASVPLHEYMEHQSRPWWSWLLGLPSRMIGGFLSLFTEEEEAGDGTLNLFLLTKEEAEMLESIKEAVSSDMDKKTGVTTVTVTLQDPLVAATVADSVVSKLKGYITSYRTRKAADDCDYLEKLYGERREEYYTAQQLYATYVDANKGLYTQDSRVEGERLANDMNLAYQVYSQAASLLQEARAREQEARPVFAVVQPATVPLQPSSPRRMMVLAGVVFLGLAGTCAWILYGKEIWKDFRQTIMTETV